MPEDLDSITELYVRISETDDIVHFKNLKKLSLQGYEISDLSPLSGLVNLTELDIYNAMSGHGEIGSGYLEDISPLTNIPNLIKSTLAWSNISDLSPLAGRQIWHT